ESNDARAHRGGKLRRREPDGALAQDCDGVVALETESMQGAPGRAGAAGDGGARREGELVGQRDERARRAFEIACMAAMAGDAVDLLHSFVAELHPAGRALRADAAAAIVMLHDAHADARLLLRDARPDR